MTPKRKLTARQDRLRGVQRSKRRTVGFASGHEKRCLTEREANRCAKKNGKPLPYPNRWDWLDTSKVEPGASPEKIARSYREFQTICIRPVRKTYTI